MKINTDMVKKWLGGLYRSWTARFNVAIGTISLMLPDILHLLEAKLPDLAFKLPPNIYPYVVAIVTLGNIYLRTRTSKPLSER